jgi:hypothetical protein
MPFEKVNNPMTGEDIEMFVGKIDKVFIKKLDKTDNYGKTHRCALAVDDGTWITLGNLKEKEDGTQPTLRVEDKQAKKWVTIGDGTEIRLPITRNGQYINAKASGIVVTKLVEPTGTFGQSNQNNASQSHTGASTGTSGGYKKDMSGMETGHAINCALEITGGKPKDMEELNDLAKQLHDITLEVKAYRKSQLGDGASDYEVGASAGHATIAACKMLTKTKVGEVKGLATRILEGVVPVVQAHVKGEAIKPESPTMEEVVNQVENDSPEDDDLPF